MKTINFKTMIIAAIASLLFFSACKKDNPAPQPPAKTMVGEWEGKYGVGNSEPASYWNFKVNKDGTINLKTKADAIYNGNGTWTLTDNVFRATYKYGNLGTKQFITAIVDVPTGVMAGKYSEITEQNAIGDFNAKRK